jgi:hypothetical protein
LPGAPEKIARAIAAGFERSLGIAFERGDLSRAEEDRARNLAERKYASADFFQKSASSLDIRKP